MSETTNMKNAIAALNALTLDEMRALIPMFNALLKTKRSVDGIKAASQFSKGDVLTWNSNKRGYPPVMYIKFMNMNRASTCAVGMRCTADGKELSLMEGGGKWTISTSYITEVNGKKLVK